MRLRRKRQTGTHRPLIGIVCEVFKKRSLWHKPSSAFELVCDYRYVRSIVKAGGLPVLIPLNTHRKQVAKLLDYLDGLVLIGGDDIYPKVYGEKVTKHTRSGFLRRFYFEKYVCAVAQKKKIPLLGICYGMHVLNVLAGGTLYQDIKSQVKQSLNHNSKRKPFHTVRIMPQSLCHTIFRKDSFPVYSEHHQAVKRVGHSLTIGAVASDGIIEAVEKPPLIIAVQWHPERQPKDYIQRHLFAYLIKQAKNRQLTRITSSA